MAAARAHATVTSPVETSPAPKPPPSERRVAANRRNAKKSTGPKTPGGKVKAAMNSLKHGLRARTPLLPGEDFVELDLFTSDLLDDLAPRTPIEYELAERVATLCWRRRRLWRAEDQIITDASNGPLPAHIEAGDEEAMRFDLEIEGKQLLAKEFQRPLRVKGIPMERGDCGLLRLYEHERRLGASIESALRMLLKVQDRRQKRNREQGLPDDGADESVRVPDEVENRLYDTLDRIEWEEEEEERAAQRAPTTNEPTASVTNEPIAPVTNEPTDPRRGTRSAAPDCLVSGKEAEESGAAQSLPRHKATTAEDRGTGREPVSDPKVQDRAPVTNEPTAAPLDDRDEDNDDQQEEDWDDPDDDAAENPIEAQAPGYKRSQRRGEVKSAGCATEAQARHSVTPENTAPAPGTSASPPPAMRQ
jgi:hypothetical protein